MSKWFGKLGFVETKETEPSAYSEIVTERDCYGDLVRNTRRLQSGDKVNDDISLANTLEENILPLWRREAAPGNFRAAFIFLSEKTRI